MIDQATINGVVSILRDIRLEAQTTTRPLERDDPVVENLQFIEDIAKIAIEKLGGDV